MDIELTPRSVFSITTGRVTQRTLDLTDILGSNTIASHTMIIYDSSGTDVTVNFGGGSSEASGIITFGVIGYAIGSYTVVFTVTCDQTTPDATALVFSVDLILEVTATPKTTEAATAEQIVSYAWLSLPELKIACQINLDTTTYDTALVQIINDVIDEIEAICGKRRFKSTSYTDERMNGNGEKMLFLKNYPITAVSSITMDGETVSAASDYTDNNKYWIEPIQNGHKYEGVLFLEDEWIKGDQNIVISYTAGYSTFPGNLRRAAIMLSKEYYKLYKSTEGKKSENISKYSYSIDLIDEKISNKIDDLLSIYKKWGYA